MTDELQLIDRLERVRRILHTNTDLADVVLLGMIEEAEQKVARFEEEHAQQEEFAFTGS
jgi:hypothetical protein